MSRETKRILSWIGLVAGVVLFIVMGVRLFADRKYGLVSVLIAFWACLIFYLAYEKKEGSIRRMVMIAVMTAITVLGRLIFAAVPGLKPMWAIIILTGIYMGPECGFLVGSLSAVVSNIFFGQGPWMLLRKRWILVLWGLLMGAMYSWIMDIWTVLSLIGKFRWSLYLAKLGTALPYTMSYMTSNVVFLMIGLKPVGEKLERIQKKHGIF